MDPKANNVWIETLGSSIKHGGSALDDVPDLLKRVLRDGAWRCFQTRMGELVEHERFAEFVSAPPLAGLGTNLDLVRRIVDPDDEATKLLRDVLKEPGARTDLRNIITEVSTVTGTARSYALDRLERDAPELHTKVVAGELSAHAAMVQAGYRPHTFTVRADHPESAARTLRKHMDADSLARLAELLTEGT